MRKIATIASAALLCVLLTLPGFAGAIDDVTTEVQAEDRQNRIKEYKDKVTEKLTAAKERKIADGCKAAQGKVTSLQNNLSKAITNRKGVYANIKERLDGVVIKLQAASIDTSSLETAIADIETQSQGLMTVVEQYNATLDDLAAIDCASDPQGFQAALTVAREQRVAVVEKAQSLKKFIQNDVKALLQEIKKQLADEKSEETDAAPETAPES